MAYTPNNFSGQGILYSAERQVSGKPGKLQDLGNGTSCKFDFKTDVMKISESRSGYRLPYGRIPKGNDAEIAITLTDFTLDNLALGLYGSKITKVAGTVTAEVLPSGLVAGDRVQLANPKVTFSALKDSAGTPATLTPTTDYIVDADPGHLDIVNVGSYVQPFKADYSYAASKKLGAFAVAPAERMLILEGINTADNYRRVRIVAFRVVLDPITGFDLINDDLAKLELKGSVLYDPTRLSNDPLGQFFSYEYLDA